MQEINYQVLREYLTSRGITTYRLAKDCHIDPSDIYAAYAGRKKLSQATRNKIAAHLGEPAEKLFPTV